MTGPHIIDPNSNWSLALATDGSFFRGVVVLFLSLIVLILVHLAHRLAQVFEWPAKTVAPERPRSDATAGSDVAGTPWEKNPGFTSR